MEQISKQSLQETVTITLPKYRLTETQKKYLAFIEAFYKQSGRYPILKEIGRFFRRVPSSVHWVLNSGSIRYNSRKGLTVKE